MKNAHDIIHYKQDVLSTICHVVCVCCVCMLVNSFGYLKRNIFSFICKMYQCNWLHRWNWEHLTGAEIKCLECSTHECVHVFLFPSRVGARRIDERDKNVLNGVKIFVWYSANAHTHSHAYQLFTSIFCTTEFSSKVLTTYSAQSTHSCQCVRVWVLVELSRICAWKMISDYLGLLSTGVLCSTKSSNPCSFRWNGTLIHGLNIS